MQQIVRNFRIREFIENIFNKNFVFWGNFAKVLTDL